MTQTTVHFDHHADDFAEDPWPDSATTAPPPVVTVPTAYAEFPAEVYPSPRPWTDTVYR